MEIIKKIIGRGMTATNGITAAGLLVVLLQLHGIEDAEKTAGDLTAAATEAGACLATAIDKIELALGIPVMFMVIGFARKFIGNGEFAKPKTTRVLGGFILIAAGIGATGCSVIKRPGELRVNIWTTDSNAYMDETQADGSTFRYEYALNGAPFAKIDAYKTALGYSGLPDGSYDLNVNGGIDGLDHTGQVDPFNMLGRLTFEGIMASMGFPRVGRLGRAPAQPPAIDTLGIISEALDAPATSKGGSHHGGHQGGHDTGHDGGHHKPPAHDGHHDTPPVHNEHGGHESDHGHNGHHVPEHSHDSHGNIVHH